LVATSLAYTIAFSELFDIYNKMLNNIEKKQDFSLLGPMHTILSGLKALWTNDMYEGVKLVRECCGAAGFLNQSGIPILIDFVSPYVTFEGDKVVMMLQAARSLIKSGRKTLMQSKVMNKHLDYIQELPTVVSDKEKLKCKA
jgi:hypothetical protein